MHVCIFSTYSQSFPTFWIFGLNRHLPSLAWKMEIKWKARRWLVGARENSRLEWIIGSMDEFLRRFFARREINIASWSSGGHLHIDTWKIASTPVRTRLHLVRSKIDAAVIAKTRPPSIPQPCERIFIEFFQAWRTRNRRLSDLQLHWRWWRH